MLERGIVALLIGAGAVTACGDAEKAAPSAPSRSSSPLSAPADPADSGKPDALLLRWRLTGGIAGMGGPGSIPDFSLYEDGRAIVPGRGTPLDLREHRLTPAARQRLVNEARAAGLDRPRTVERPGVSDAFTLVITFGPARTRIVHPEGQNDPAVRFWKRLAPAGWASGDQVGPARPYPFKRLALLAGETSADTGTAAKPWPLGPLGQGEQAGGGICTIVTGQDLETAAKLGRSAQPGATWSSAGKVYSLRFRALLPDESTCADLDGRK